MRGQPFNLNGNDPFSQAVLLLGMLGMDQNPEDPRHYYDLVTAIQQGAKSGLNEQDGRIHWPDDYKRFGHPTYSTRFDESVPIARGPVADLNDGLLDMVFKYADILKSGQWR